MFCLKLTYTIDSDLPSRFSKARPCRSCCNRVTPNEKLCLCSMLEWSHEDKILPPPPSFFLLLLFFFFAESVRVQNSKINTAAVAGGSAAPSGRRGAGPQTAGARNKEPPDSCATSNSSAAPAKREGCCAPSAISLCSFCVAVCAGCLVIAATTNRLLLRLIRERDDSSDRRQWCRRACLFLMSVRARARACVCVLLASVLMRVLLLLFLCRVCCAVAGGATFGFVNHSCQSTRWTARSCVPNKPCSVFFF